MDEIIKQKDSGGLQLLNYDMLVATVLSAQSTLSLWSYSNNIYLLSLTAYMIQQSVEKAIRIQLQQASDEAIMRWSNISGRPANTYNKNIKTHRINVLYSIVDAVSERFVDSEYFRRRQNIFTLWEERGRYNAEFSVSDGELSEAITELNRWVPVIKKVFNFQSVTEKKDFLDYTMAHLRTMSPAMLEDSLKNSYLSRYNIHNSNNTITLTSDSPLRRSKYRLDTSILSDIDNKD